MIRLLTARGRRVTAGNDDGVALILALVFILTISIVVTALLPYVNTGIKTADAVRDVRTVQNAADGAVDEAINSIRGSLTRGLSPACSAATLPQITTADYPNPAPLTGSTKTRVYYCYQAPPVPDPTDNDQPPYAIQTLNQGVTVDGNAPLTVAGGVLAAGPITVSGTQQSLNVDGDVFSTGQCDISVIAVTGDFHCTNTPTVYNASSDPDPTVDPLRSGSGDPIALSNPLAAGLPATVDPVGTCIAGRDDSVVAFSPGFYSQSPQPDSDPTSSTYCGTGNKHVVWWFQPGTYYFDFPDSRFAGYTNGDASFSAQNMTIIGGTPLGWVPATAVASDVAGMFKNGPNSTDHSPICDQSKPGVSFLFGGPTNISIGTGGTAPSQLEICAATQGTHQISLMGMRTSDGAQRSATATGPNPYAEPTATAVGYAQPNNAKVIDGTPPLSATNSAIANLSGDNTATAPKIATLSLTGGVDPFSAAANKIPQGALITLARLRLVYTTTVVGTASHVTNSVTYSSTKLPSTTVNGLPANSPSGGSLITLPITGTPTWKALKAAVSDLQLTFKADGSLLTPTSVSKQGKVTPAETAVSTLDGLQLEVSYVPPAVETVRCLPGVTGACNIVTNKVDDTVFLHGTVYTPQSILEVAVHNYSSTVFERGVIASSVIAHVSASTKQTLPPFQLPKPVRQRYVRFVAQSQEPDGTWRTRLVAYVHYIDVANTATGKTQISPGISVKIIEWTVVRNPCTNVAGVCP